MLAFPLSKGAYRKFQGKALARGLILAIHADSASADDEASPYSKSILHHTMFDEANGFCWVKILRTNISAIHDGMTAEQLIGII